jgi:protein gp37
MAENSKIEWCDHTFNPWIGCTKVSAACDHCYAETWDKRFSGERWGPHAARTRTKPANWHKPVKWNREAEASGKRARVFCASLADVFDNHRSILPEWRADLWRLIAATPHLDWLLLTKRPQNIAKMLPEGWGNGWRNVWLGTTAENQEEADRRIPHLLATPAAVRFISAEPLLGPVDLETAWHGETALDAGCWGACGWCANGHPPLHDCKMGRGSGDKSGLDWVICGGESGPGARPMHPDWARSLRDQCEAAGVAFHFKQWGEWAPDTGPLGGGKDPIMEGKAACAVWRHGAWDFHENGYTPAGYGNDEWMFRLGKRAAGRLLDGRTHDNFPEAAR